MYRYKLSLISRSLLFRLNKQNKYDNRHITTKLRDDRICECSH